MDDMDADRLARLHGGEPYESADATWLVVLRRDEGRVVILTDTSVDEYEDWEAFEQGSCDASIRLV
jgi:hypothetical protein